MIRQARSLDEIDRDIENTRILAITGVVLNAILILMVGYVDIVAHNLVHALNSVF